MLISNVIAPQMASEGPGRPGGCKDVSWTCNKVATCMFNIMGMHHLMAFHQMVGFHNVMDICLKWEIGISINNFPTKIQIIKGCGTLPLTTVRDVREE